MSEDEFVDSEIVEARSPIAGVLREVSHSAFLEQFARLVC